MQRAALLKANAPCYLVLRHNPVANWDCLGVEMMTQRRTALFSLGKIVKVNSRAVSNGVAPSLKSTISEIIIKHFALVGKLWIKLKPPPFLGAA
jgi:hypothetical protein